jgi:hypothetical protein
MRCGVGSAGQLAFDAHILERDRGPIYIIGPFCCPVFRGLSFAGSALFSELLDIGCAKATAISRAPAVVQTFEQKYGLGKSRRAFDSGRSTCRHSILRRAVSPPSGLRPEVVVHPDSNDIACG